MKDKGLTKTKRMMILTAMLAFSKKFENVHNSCVFALSNEKAKSSKVQIKSATQKAANYFSGIPQLNITGTDTTVLNFCIGASDLLIENSQGSVTIRNFEAIKTAATEQLKTIETSEGDDSHKLINALT